MNAVEIAAAAKMLNVKASEIAHIQLAHKTVVINLHNNGGAVVCHKAAFQKAAKKIAPAPKTVTEFRQVLKGKIKGLSKMKKAELILAWCEVCA